MAVILLEITHHLILYLPLTLEPIPCSLMNHPKFSLGAQSTVNSQIRAYFPNGRRLMNISSLDWTCFHINSWAYWLHVETILLTISYLFQRNKNDWHSEFEWLRAEFVPVVTREGEFTCLKSCCETSLYMCNLFALSFSSAERWDLFRLMWILWLSCQIGVSL